jgi:uncharacterized membrane protein YfcA
MIFHTLIAVAATFAGAIASVAGFGIGSMLTPLFALHFGTKLAVVAVSIPHLIATALRFVRISEHVDKRVFVSFGVTSAAAGLLGALLHARFSSTVLSYVLGGLLVFAGIMGVTGLSRRMRFEGVAAWISGSMSGAFGALVGNQGGIRSPAMLGMRVSKESFVATAIAIALVVDVARMPVYAVITGKTGAGHLARTALGDHWGRPGNACGRTHTQEDPRTTISLRRLHNDPGLGRGLDSVSWERIIDGHERAPSILLRI